MSQAFLRAWHRTHGVEGDFSHDPLDSGGPTRFGITEATARANGYSGPMSELPFEKAVEIAKARWWDYMRLDEVHSLSPGTAYEVFDTGYNMGQSVAVAFLQRSLNVLNRRQSDYPDLKVDGKVGPITISTLKKYLDIRGSNGEIVLLRMLNSLQGARYISLAEAREKDEKFMFGWFLQRVNMEN